MKVRDGGPMCKGSGKGQRGGRRGGEEGDRQDSPRHRSGSHRAGDVPWLARVLPAKVGLPPLGDPRKAPQIVGFLDTEDPKKRYPNFGNHYFWVGASRPK